MGQAPSLSPKLQEKADLAMRYINSYREELRNLHGDRAELTERIEATRDHADREIAIAVRGDRHDDVARYEARAAKQIATFEGSLRSLDQVIKRTQQKAQRYLDEYLRVTGVQVTL